MIAGKILIVEDDPDLLHGLSVRLRSSGYAISHAIDGVGAVRLAVNDPPDVIILDLGIPAGDGFTVMQRLKTLTPSASIPIIVLTARDPCDARARSMEAGALAFFQKPVDNDELLAAIFKAQAAGNPSVKRELSAAPTASRILVVDDDRDMQTGLGVRLRASGYDVVSAADGVSAISMTRSKRPDLIILDIGLPCGDGFVVMERLRAIFPGSPPPIIILSAREAEANQARALRAGAIFYLQKPADNKVLLDIVRTALQREMKPVR
jgi:DNA-binding response OmpR family regulator